MLKRDKESKRTHSKKKSRIKGSVYYANERESIGKPAIIGIKVTSPLIPHASRTAKSPRWAGSLPTRVFVGSGVKIGE